jgi:hypothetical protein
VYLFSSGVFKHTSTLNLKYSNMALKGEGRQTVLWFSGAGYGINSSSNSSSIGAASPPTEVFDLHIQDLMLKGSAVMTHGIVLRSSHRPDIKDVSVIDAVTASIYYDYSILGKMENPRTYEDGGPSAFYNSTFQPNYGIWITANGTFSTTQTIINPRIQGGLIGGIFLENAIYCTILGGAVEFADKAIIISGSNNTVNGTDLESNNTADLAISGGGNLIVGVSSALLVTLTDGVYNRQPNRFVGGQYTNITVNTAAANNEFVNISYSGTFTDNGLGTTKNNVHNITKSSYDINTAGTFNEIANGDFTGWLNGTSLAPNSWTLDGAGAAVARDTAARIGVYSALLTRSGADAALAQSIHFNKGISAWRGERLSFSCWVFATAANRARLRVYDGVTAFTSPYHSGSSTWELLTVQTDIGSAATVISAELRVDGGNTSAYFSGASAVIGTTAGPYNNRPATAWASTAASTGVGSVKMGNATAATNTGWLKAEIGNGFFVYVPYWATDLP